MIRRGGKLWTRLSLGPGEGWILKPEACEEELSKLDTVSSRGRTSSGSDQHPVDLSRGQYSRDVHVRRPSNEIGVTFQAEHFFKGVSLHWSADNGPSVHKNLLVIPKSRTAYGSI